MTHRLIRVTVAIIAFRLTARICPPCDGTLPRPSQAAGTVKVYGYISSFFLRDDIHPMLIVRSLKDGP